MLIPMLKTFGPVLISLLTAIAIIVTALLTKGTANENAWLIVFAIGSLLAAFFELFVKMNERKKKR
jgi:ABC-type molybdate transport system substrate-binding protein